MTAFLMLTTLLAAPADSRLAIIKAAPPFALMDQDGKTTKLGALRGKVLLVSFVFTTCNGTCPATTHRMCLIQDELRRRGLLKQGDVQLLTITLDPDKDTPAALRHYMSLYDVDAAHWRFLTGESKDVKAVIADWGLWTKPMSNGQLDHPARVYLVDRELRIREIYNLGFLRPQWVCDDIELLRQER